MRIKPGESYESWAHRVEQYEHGYALQRIAQGDDIDKVLEDMSVRIVQKMTHPLIVAIRESTNTPFDAAASRKSYEEKYLKDHPPVPDHIDDSLT